MAAKSNTKTKSSKKSSGGSMMNMRSGIQSMTGSSAGRKGKARRKKETTFWNVLAWVAGFALLCVLIWMMRR